MENYPNITLIQIFNNEEKLYHGKDLWYYAKKIFFEKNANNQYHNFRHTMHVTYQVYDAIRFMKMNPISARFLLIAAMFHDYGHTGKGNLPDSQNIEKAVKAVKRHLHKDDKEYQNEIIRLIRSTEWITGVGHNIFDEDIFINILRDADMSQTFDNAWIQQVIFGLGYEKNLSRRDMLKAQLPFLEKVKFSTVWGQKKFIPILKQMIEEVKIWQEKLL